MNKWYAFWAIISCFLQHRVIDKTWMCVCTSPLGFSSSLVFSNFSGPVKTRPSSTNSRQVCFMSWRKRGWGVGQSSPLKIFLKLSDFISIISIAYFPHGNNFFHCLLFPIMDLILFQGKWGHTCQGSILLNFPKTHTE